MMSNQETFQASVIEARLSSRQRFWLKHLQACEAGGKTLKAYAKRKGLSVHGLYGARRRLRLAGMAPCAVPAAVRCAEEQLPWLPLRKQEARKALASRRSAGVSGIGADPKRLPDRAVGYG